MSFPYTVSILESVMNHNSINKVASKFSIMHIDGMRLSITCLGVEVNVSLPISPSLPAELSLRRWFIQFFPWITFDFHADTLSLYQFQKNLVHNMQIHIYSVNIPNVMSTIITRSIRADIAGRNRCVWSLLYVLNGRLHVIMTEGTDKQPV